MGYLPMFVALHHGFLKDEISTSSTRHAPQSRPQRSARGEVEYHGVASSALRLAPERAGQLIFSAPAAQLFLDGRPNIKSVRSCAANMSPISRFSGTTDTARVALQ
jgi:hypothetical protein